jgi:hypothetical protein
MGWRALHFGRSPDFGGRYLMVVGLDLDTKCFQRQRHFTAQILQTVDGRNRKIALLLPRLVAEIRGLLRA